MVYHQTLVETFVFLFGFVEQALHKYGHISQQNCLTVGNVDNLVI